MRAPSTVCLSQLTPRRRTVNGTIARSGRNTVSVGTCVLRGIPAAASLQSLPAENSTAVHAGDNLSEKEREKLFREFENSASHHAGDDLSEKEREKLFTEFLEWSRRPPD